jgi:hypothetical protein
LLQNDGETIMTTETVIKPNTVLLAAAKGFTDKMVDTLRDEATIGVHEVDAVLNIKGSITIHPDYVQTQVNKVCPWTFLQVAWNKMPEHVRAACVREVQEVLDGTRPAPELNELKALTKAAVSRVKINVSQTSRGPTKFNGKIWVA